MTKKTPYKGPGADSEEKHEPASDIDTMAVVDSLKVLDPKWPVREADSERTSCHVRKVPIGKMGAIGLSRDDITVRLAHDGYYPDKTSRLIGDGNKSGVEHHARAIQSQSLDIEHVVGPVV